MDPDDRLVEASELKAYMSDLGLEADQETSLQDVLDGCQRELERYCKRPFFRRERTEQVVPDELGRLWPKATPIVSWTAPAAGYVRAAGRNALVGEYGSFGYGGGLLGDPYAEVTVTYVGGLDPDGDELDDVKLAILRVAAREATTRHDDVLNVNDLQERRVDDRDKKALGFQKDELEKFDTLRRRTAV